MAWRRLKWTFRLYAALWWACERGSLRRHAHEAPDVEGFEKDVGAALDEAKRTCLHKATDTAGPGKGAVVVATATA